VPELLAAADAETPIFEAYRAHYERLAEEDLRSSIQLEDHHRIETQRLADALGQLEGLDVCDVGVGKGILLELLAGRGARSITGVDISRRYLERLAANPDIRVVLASAERLPFESEFDVVVSADVLEHVLNPGDFLLSVRRALRTGGRFVVRVPYRDDLVAYATSCGYPYPFVHLRSFDKRGLRDLLDSAGFTVRGVSFSGFYTLKLRRALAGTAHVQRRASGFLERRFGGPGQVTKIHPRLGRALMQPNTITVDAVRAER
jgi:SAM-dependent methyltransferase